MCLGTWASHTDYYSCNKFDSARAKEADKSKQSSRVALERYLFHFHRYQNHEASRKLEGKTRAEAERKISEAAGRAAAGGGKVLSWGDAGFIVSATETAIACRGVLKWTYVLAHSLEDDTADK